MTFLQGDVEHGDEAIGFDDLIVRGSRLATHVGRVTIQYADNSGFTLGPNSTLAVERFDHTAVVLHVEGEIIADITRRSAGQQFVVVAGEREVRVRGTIFKVVQRKERFEVACSRGAVVIANGRDEIDLKAGELARFVGNGIRRGPLPVDQSDELEHAVPRLPTWSEAEALQKTSSRLDIAPSAKEPAIQVDGITVGKGPFALRVTPGRHHVQLSGTTGQWVELQAGSSHKPPLKEAVETRPTRKRESRRRTEIRRVLDKRLWIEACARPLRKQGIAKGGFVTLEIAVGTRGEIRYLNVLDSNLPNSSEQCIRNAADRLVFPAGPNSVVRYRITL